MKEKLKALKLSQFVVFDVETTGTDPQNDKMIEIAAIKYKDGEIFSQFSHLIDPGRKISEEISIITGIKNEDIKGKPDIDEILPEFIEFVSDLPLVGHNIDFDLGFLKAAIEDHDRILLLGSSRFYDTLLLSQIFFPVEVSNHRLSTLTEYFGFSSENMHRAYNDSAATGYLFLQIIERALESSEDVIRKLTEVSGKSDLKYVKEFFNSAANYFLKTAFGRKIKTKERSYSISNILHALSEPSAEELEKISKEDINDKIFKPGGEISRQIKNFEYREEQHIMADKCSDAFRYDKILVSEAGTGVGKSFAYLIPSIIFTLLNKERVIVSTNTKNLQEQIFFKDLPVLHEMFNSTFKAVLLKGRNNYLCKARYERFLSRPDEYLSNDDYEKFLPLIYWAERTSTGDIEENNGFKIGFARFLWQRLASDKGFCSGKKCPKYNECYLQNIRKSAFKSDLVIINHSLLFSDMASENAVLGGYDRLIIDEAHNVESSATKYLGFEYNYFHVKNLVQRINYNNRQGIYVRIDKGSDWFKTDKSTISDLNGQLNEKGSNVLEQAKKTFDLATDKLITENSNGASGQFTNIRNRYRDIGEVFAFEKENTVLRFLYEELISILKRLDIIFNIEAEKNHEFDDLSGEIKSVIEQAEGVYESFTFFLNSNRENYVFWYDIAGSENREVLSLYAAPLDVSSILKNDLYDNMKTMIFTSATLTIENRFKYMLKKLGLSDYDEDRMETLMLGTPFDLQNQLQIIAPSYISSPKNPVVFESDVVQVLKLLCDDHDNGTLVLFTSYYQMNSVFKNIQNSFIKKERVISVQNKETSRTNLIKQFRSVRNSFLLGTDSFWEGIDVPGDALHTLVMTKLPFAVPTEPVVQARTEELEKNGIDSFMGYSVPETILKFKQGIGRLIRHREDHGIIMILDSRTVNTRWGAAFLNSLPVQPEIPRNFADLKRLLLK